MRWLVFIVVAVAINAIAAGFSDTFSCGWLFGWFMAMTYNAIAYSKTVKP